MSWRYLPELVEGFSEDTFLDGERSALSSGPSIPEKPYCDGSETALCLSSRSGMMSRHSTGDLGLDWWMLSLEDSHARTSAQRERELESTASVRGCGPTWHGSSAKYDPASRSWKTAQCSLLAGLDEFSATWPRWGSMRNGEFLERSTPGRRISESGSGLWPTIRAQDGERGGRGDLIQAVRGNENSHFRLWPTPQAHKTTESGEIVNSDGTPWDGIRKPHSKKSGKPITTALADAAVFWATTTVCGNYNKKGASAKSGDGLATQAGGALNPDWVEWLMGWPIGWTACEPLEMGKSQQWPQWHSGNCPDA